MSVWDGYQLSFGAFLFLATLGAAWWLAENAEEAVRRHRRKSDIEQRRRRRLRDRR